MTHQLKILHHKWPNHHHPPKISPPKNDENQRKYISNHHQQPRPPTAPTNHRPLPHYDHKQTYICFNYNNHAQIIIVEGLHQYPLSAYQQCNLVGIHFSNYLGPAPTTVTTQPPITHHHHHHGRHHHATKKKKKTTTTKWQQKKKKKKTTSVF